MFLQSRRLASAAVPALVLVLAGPARAEWQNGRTLTLTASSEVPLQLQIGYSSNGALSRVGIEQVEDGQSSITVVEPVAGGPTAAAATWARVRLQPGETVNILLENEDEASLTLAMFRLWALKGDGSRVELGVFTCQMRGFGADAHLVVNPGMLVEGCSLKAGEADALELIYRPAALVEGKAQAGAGAASLEVAALAPDADADAASLEVVGAAPGAGACTDPEAAGRGSKRKADGDPESAPAAKRHQFQRNRGGGLARLDPEMRASVVGWLSARPAHERYPSEVQKTVWLNNLRKRRPGFNRDTLKKQIGDLLVNTRQRLLPLDRLKRAVAVGKAAGEVDAEALDPAFAGARRVSSRRTPEEPEPDQAMAEEEAQNQQRSAGKRERVAQNRSFLGDPAPIPRVAGIPRFTAYTVFVKEQTAAGVSLAPRHMSQLWRQLTKVQKRGYKRQAHLNTQAAHFKAAQDEAEAPAPRPSRLPLVPRAASPGAGAGAAAGAGTRASSPFDGYAFSFSTPYSAATGAAYFPFFQQAAPELQAVPSSSDGLPSAGAGADADEVRPLSMARAESGLEPALPAVGPADMD